MTDPNPDSDVTYVHGSSGSMRVVASTGLEGFELGTGTPDIISWTAPDDGQLHSVAPELSIDVSAPLTGGKVIATFTMPDGIDGYTVGLNGAETSGAGYDYNLYTGYFPMLIAPGGRFTISQGDPVTAGAAKLWARIRAD